MLLRLSAIVLLVLVTALPTVSFAGAEPDAPLPHDTAVVYGTLSNGMRYWIRPGVKPAGKVTLWLRIGSGSLNEEHSERGLAHFLEHMAFNGSANFPAGTLIQRFESAGLTFGAHQNATTGFLDTVYKLAIPNTSDTLDLSLLYFADVAGRLTLAPEEVERERHVVLAERRARDNAANRAFNKQLFALVPDSRFATRLPLGDEAVIRGANAAQLRAYYKKWYRPDNAALLVAGDVDVKTLEEMIRKHFGSWAADGPRPVDTDPGIRPYTSDQAQVINEYGLISAELNLARIEAPRDFGSLKGYRHWLVQRVANRIINTRLREQVLEGRAPYDSASIASDTSFGANLVETRAKGEPDRWLAMVHALYMELKRVREHGFDAGELEQAAEIVRTEYERDALEEADISAARWVSMMDRAIEESRRPFSPRQEYALVQKLLPTIAPIEVEQAIRAHYTPGQRMLVLALPRRSDLKPPSPDELLKIAHAAEALPVAPLAARAAPKHILARDPKPGTVERQSLDEDLQVLSATLANGVRVHVRPMEYQKGHVSVRITLAGGRIIETAENRGITEVAALPFRTPATDTWGSTDLRRLIAPKHISVSGRDTAGALELDVTGQRRDLEDGLRIAYLLLTSAHIEAPMFDMWQRQAIERQANREGSVDAQLNDRVDSILTSDDPRFRGLSPDNARRLTRERGQVWLDGLLRQAPIEVAIVGDISTEEALRLATKYLGALPQRDRTAGAYAKVRTLQSRPGPHKSVVKVDTATPKAMVYVGWRGADWQNVGDWQALDLAGRILTNRLLAEVRERRGLAYSIRARSSPHTLFNGNSRFRVSFAVDPLKADEAALAVEHVVDEFLRTGPTEAELATAREQAVANFRSGLRGPDFWLEILADLEYMGANLDWIKAFPQNIQRYTPEQVVAVVKKYLRSDSFLRVIGAPSDLPTAAAEGERRPAANIN